MAAGDAQVLVVGGGPVGLTMACELRRYGVSCRIVDKNPAPQEWSKAAAVTARTLECLRDVGVADRLHERGTPVHGMNVQRGAQRLAHVTITLEGTPFPYILGVSQRDTELVLAERLKEHGVPFERSTELVAVEQTETAVRARLRGADGREEDVETPYLVGCDGAHSTVRGALGFTFEGSTFEQTLWQADIRVDWPFESDAHEGYAFPSDNGMMIALPLHADGRYRLIALAPPHPDREPTLEGMREVAAQRLPEGTEISDPAWIVAFRFHGRIADHYRSRRMFLAGDAGHIHSPVGGQGMNLGIQDAYNLAWKLALVLRGEARESLLDSYEPERRPIAQGIVSGTDFATRNIARALKLRHPLAVQVRTQLISTVFEIGFLQARGLSVVSGLRVAYPDSPIVGEHHSSLWKAEVGERQDERPGVRDWMQFSEGPGPGQRVPDVDLLEGAPAETLHELLLGMRHVLLLFDGAAATESGYENLSSIAKRVEKRLGDRVRVFVVLPRRDRPEVLSWKGATVHDEDGSLHTHFGCGSEGAYLIRPDGYVAFRTQPADEKALLGYVDTIFTP